MRKILFATGAVALAALTAGCGTLHDAICLCASGATYYGDRAMAGTPIAPLPRRRYAYPSNSYPSTTGYYYSRGDYYRNYQGIHSAPERNM